MKKLEKVLNISLIIQILLYTLGAWTEYRATHDGISSFNGLEALFYFGFFFFLGAVNLILFIVFIVYFLSLQHKKNKIPIKIYTFILIIIVITLALAQGNIIHFVSRLPGSDLP